MDRFHNAFFVFALLIAVAVSVNMIMSIDSSSQSTLFEFEGLTDITSASISEIPATSFGMVMLFTLVVVLGFLYFRSLK